MRLILEMKKFRRKFFPCMNALNSMHLYDAYDLSLTKIFSYILFLRTCRNLWNFSPKHLFTDSSGMYWRERRVRPGLYTDGNTVYEASYRYRDGRNGMHRQSSFQQFLASKGFSKKQKDKIQKRLREDAPDLVIEE